MKIRHFLLTAMATALSWGSAAAVELPSSYDFESAEVAVSYNASTNTIQLKITPTSFITYTEDGVSKRMDLETIDQLEIRRGGKDAAGDYHNTTYVIKTLENVAAGRTQIYNDTDILPGERYVYYIRTYIGEDHDWPSSNEIYTYVKPGQIEQLKVATADAKGSLPVTVSGVAPAKTETGESLPAGSLTAVVILRAPYDVFGNEEFVEVGRIDNPEAGKSFSWTDNTAELNKLYTYGVYAAAGDYAGETAKATIRTGQDLPMAPKGLAVVNNMTSLELSWEAVTAGENEGYINPDDMTYSLYEFRTDRYPEDDDEVLLAEGIKGTTYTADFSTLTRPEKKILRLRACSPAGEGDYSTFAIQIVGNPASLPWNDDFNRAVNAWGGTTSERCWTIKAQSDLLDPTLYFTTYGIYYSDPYNNVGVMQYTGVDGDISDPDNELREGLVSGFYDKAAVDMIISEPINFADAKYPVVSFYVYQLPSTLESTNFVEVMALAADSEAQSQGTAECFGADGDGSWKQFFVGMPALAGCPVGRLQLNANAGAFPASVSIDKVEIEDYPCVTDLAFVLDEDLQGATLTWSDPSTESHRAEGYTVYVDGAIHSAEKMSDTTYHLSLAEKDPLEVAVKTHTDNGIEPMSATLRVSRSGISEIVAADGSVTVYTTLTGMRVARPTSGGIFIKTTVKPDGSRTSEKVVR